MHLAIPAIGHIPPLGSPRRRIAARGVSGGIYQANRKHKGFLPDKNWQVIYHHLFTIRLRGGLKGKEETQGQEKRLLT